MRVFAFGSNGSGQLAIGHTEDVSTPTECLFTTPAPTDKITKISPCDPNERETSQTEETILRFRRLVLTDRVTAKDIDTFKCISATWEGSILVPSTADKVFVLGSTPKGELGLGKDLAATAPTQVLVEPGLTIPDFPPAGTTIVSVASGMGHTVAILSNGQVYGWGGSRKGQLGASLKEEKIVWSPAKVGGVPFFATGAVCGREFTVVIGKRAAGEFAVLGDEGNRWGIMDIPDSLRVSSGESGSGRKEYLDIGASWHGIYVHVSGHDSDFDIGSDSLNASAASATGSLIAWGRNDRGQLPPPNLPPLSEIGVGSEHVLTLLEDGSVATFGWGEHGNCGPNTDARGNVAGKYNLIPLPDDVPGARVVGVSAGCATSWLIVE
ncbi:hypothetical protein N7481_011439 [Penicillium waksmanii]|uniref:uncharacterized protein n=1 Tax=Penicillium waksmanii TaxID=69791 RepID=UPI002547A1C1|nr:uncharacterized protein N7481_011439 [Penicillium waksmanii]KAJ5974229.1 hypothetical protein N7481_011439 [Penicillium waksmanii]